MFILHVYGLYEFSSTFLSLYNSHNALFSFTYFLDIIGAIFVINIMRLIFPIFCRRQFPDLDTLIQTQVMPNHSVTTM